ncbi:MAG TPA: PLDc N-terminal domain-containing protein [Ktedonobacterales bacterium]|nr:PLDc N-terminal domain-containing protein [Ktedonobacterales bacterium]
MKLIMELLVAIVLHPVAVVLTWIDESRRTDMTTTTKVIWGIVALVWGIGPILYILLGGGTLWGGRGEDYLGPTRTRGVA